MQFDQPIGSYQLIQLKLAKMEVARLNLESLVFRYIEARAAGKDLTLAEASANARLPGLTDFRVATALRDTLFGGQRFHGATVAF